jgi:hypothetical protein
MRNGALAITWFGGVFLNMRVLKSLIDLCDALEKFVAFFHKGCALRLGNWLIRHQNRLLRRCVARGEKALAQARAQRLISAEHPCGG